MFNTLNLIIQGTIGLIMVVTFLIYFFQLKTMKKGTLGQNSISLINYLQDEKAREARRIVMTIIKGMNPKAELWKQRFRSRASGN